MSSIKRKAVSEPEPAAVFFDSNTESLAVAGPPAFDLDIHLDIVDAVKNHEISLDTFKIMASVLTPDVSPDIRMFVLARVVHSAANVAMVKPESKLDYIVGMNDWYIQYAAFNPHGPPIPEWRQVAFNARKAMEKTVRGIVAGPHSKEAKNIFAAEEELKKADAAASIIRDQFEQVIAEQKAREDRVFNKHRKLAVTKARVFLDRIVGSDVIQICACIGVGTSVQGVSEAHGRNDFVSHTLKLEYERYWQEGARMMFGDLLARCSRALLPRLQFRTLLDMWEFDADPSNTYGNQEPPPDSEVAIRWVGYAQFHSIIADAQGIFYNSNEFRESWDEMVLQSGEASNAVAVLGQLKGGRLYKDAIVSIGRMINPHLPYPRAQHAAASSSDEKRARLAGKGQLMSAPSERKTTGRVQLTYDLEDPSTNFTLYFSAQVTEPSHQMALLRRILQQFLKARQLRLGVKIYVVPGGELINLGVGSGKSYIIDSVGKRRDIGDLPPPPNRPIKQQPEQKEEEDLSREQRALKKVLNEANAETKKRLVAKHEHETQVAKNVFTYIENADDDELDPENIDEHEQAMSRRDIMTARITRELAKRQAKLEQARTAPLIKYGW